MAYQSWAKWTLFNVDTFEEFEGQFPLENVVQNLGANYESSWSMNRNDPVSQWIHGTVKTWSFSATFRAKDSTDDLRSKIKFLEDSVLKDDKLGRPPLYVWTWGSVEFTCFITSLGGIEWQMAPPASAVQIGGMPRQVRFNITLQKYVPWDLKVTDPNAPFSDTFYKKAKIGNTYEHFAAELYGQAILGDLVRRRFPELAYPTIGKVIAMPDADKLLEEEVEPESVPLQRTEEGLEARQELFELRNTSKVSHVL